MLTALMFKWHSSEPGVLALCSLRKASAEESRRLAKAVWGRTA